MPRSRPPYAPALFAAHRRAARDRAVWARVPAVVGRRRSRGGRIADEGGIDRFTGNSEGMGGETGQRPTPFRYRGPPPSVELDAHRQCPARLRTLRLAPAQAHPDPDDSRRQSATEAAKRSSARASAWQSRALGFALSK